MECVLWLPLCLVKKMSQIEMFGRDGRRQSSFVIFEQGIADGAGRV
jgi:hypothetical protein